MAKSVITKEYFKELKRIKRFIKSAEKRGYYFSSYKIPSPPKRITKRSIQALQKITPDVLYRKAEYYDILEGKIIRGDKARKLIRSRASKKAAITRKLKDQKIYSTSPGQPPSDIDTILKNMKDLISNWQPIYTWSESYKKLKENDRNILKRILEGAINNLGITQVAKNIEQHADEVKELVFHIIYGSSDFKWEDIQGDIAAITAIIYGRSLNIPESKELQESIDLTLYYEDED